MPREQLVVRPDGLKARVVSFEREDEWAGDVKVDVQRTVEEIEWARFQLRWAKWKREFNFVPPDPSNLQAQFHG